MADYAMDDNFFPFSSLLVVVVVAAKADDEEGEWL